MDSSKNRKQYSVVGTVLFLTFFLLISMAFAHMSSQHFGIPVSTLDSGGGRQRSNHFDLQNSMGQSMPPGISQSVNFGLFAGFQSCTIEELILLKGKRGDVDDNGSINVLDILAVANHILGILPLTGDAYERADCDGNGTINILDALGIANVILGIFPECPGGTAKIQIYPEALEFLKSLEHYLPRQDVERFMNLLNQVGVPAEYGLSQDYPNPFNPTTTITYSIPVQSEKSKVKGKNSLNLKPSTLNITLKVYNILGQEVATLVDEEKEPGRYSVTWDGSAMASGVYFYRLEVGTFTETKRMVLMK